jgi:predicted nucleotidyltransferase
VQAGAGQLGLEPLLVGATARDLLLVHVFEQPVRRATLDVDFAVALASWEQFEALKAEVDQRVWLPGRAATKAAADLRG